MVIRLGNLINDWLFAEADQEMRFSGKEARTVKADVRTEVRCSLFMDSGDGPVFLCVIDGYESIEFIAEGPFVLTCDGPFYVRTADSSYTAAENVDDEIFTRMHEKRPIDPLILEMQRVLFKNEERRRAQMMRDVAGMIRSTERQNERNRQAAEEAAGRAKPDEREDEDDRREPPAETVGKGGKVEGATDKDAPKK